MGLTVMTDSFRVAGEYPEVWSEPSEETHAGISSFSFILYLYFVVDVFLHFPARVPGYGAVRPTVLVFLIIAISLFAQYDKIKYATKDPIYKAIIALIVYIVLSLPLVEWPGSVIRENWEPFIKAVAFFFFTALIIDTDKRLRIFLLVFIGCQVFRVLEPLYLNITSGYWGSSTHLGGEFADRLSGAPADVVNPNGLGFVIVTAIPFLHYLLFAANKKGKILYFLLLPPLLYALILTMSRGAFVALLVVAGMIFFQSKHKLVLIFVAVGIAFAGWNVMSPVQKDRYLSLFSENTENAVTVEGRWNLIIREFGLGFERPIVGHGLGTTAEAKTHSWGRRQASHNLYGQLLIEIGLIGFVFFFIYLWRIYKRFKYNQDILKRFEGLSKATYYHRLNQAMTAVFWMYAVYSLNYFGLSQYYWYMFGGLAVAYGRLLTLRLEPRMESSGGKAV